MATNDGRCPARNRRGEKCGQPLPEGAVVCRFHGGASPAAKAKAAERRAEAQARRVLAALGDTRPSIDPITELLDLAGQAKALVDVLRPVVADLEEVSYPGGAGQEQVRGELQAYLAALGRAESILGRIVSLGLEERRLRVSELQAAAMAEALTAVLAHSEIALDTARQTRARELLSAELEVRSR